MQLAKATLTLLALAAPVLAGPPLICHTYSIGNDRSLPMGGQTTSWNNPDPNYDTRNLTADTLKLLASPSPLLTRMETMRRAAIYAGKNPAAGLELATRLVARALSSEVKGQNDSVALFDAGYFIESLKQYAHMTKIQSFADVDGYDWVRRSVPGLQDKLTAEYAMGLMAAHTSWPNEHIRRAVSGAQEGSLLAENLMKHFSGQTLASVKRSLATKSAATR